jgi:hypothetical protein
MLHIIVNRSMRLYGLLTSIPLNGFVSNNLMNPCFNS